MYRKMQRGADITEDIVKLCTNAERNVNQLNHLVDDLLDFNKIDQGELVLTKTNFKMGDVIDGCCTHIRLEGKYMLTYTGDHSLMVYADQYKIDQVLVNFVNNAVKYAADSLEIIIHVEKIAGFTKVTVIDKGKGIAPDDIKHLFDRYYRIGADINLASGLGLGLYISAEIIKRHGGKIGVKSILGKGSNFWFTIPDQY